MWIFVSKYEYYYVLGWDDGSSPSWRKLKRSSWTWFRILV